MIKAWKKISLLFWVFCASNLHGQVQSYFVKPIQTDAQYNALEDSNSISTNLTNKRNRLFLFIGGTNSSSSNNYSALRLRAANLGFDVINLSYPNKVAAASLANDMDSLAFDKYRQEICFGTSLSSAVAVDSFNSIYTRTLKLLHYLNQTYPTQNWGQYLRSANQLNWSKIAVGGHSQGSGHACYLAKKFLVHRVLMFSGPNDYSNTYSNSAPWLRQTGITPIGYHYSYLSIKDEVVSYGKQFTNISGLGMLVSDDSTHADVLPSPFNNSHCLYTTQKPGIAILNHNSPIKFSAKNNEVWDYMLTTPNPMKIRTFKESIRLKAQPNPSSDLTYIQTEQSMLGKTYFLYNPHGKLIASKEVTAHHGFTVDLSQYLLGIYFLHMNGQILKLVKE